MTSEPKSEKVTQLPPGSLGTFAQPPCKTVVLETPRVGASVDSPAELTLPAIPTKVPGV